MRREQLFVCYKIVRLICKFTVDDREDEQEGVQPLYLTYVAVWDCAVLLVFVYEMILYIIRKSLYAVG